MTWLPLPSLLRSQYLYLWTSKASKELPASAKMTSLPLPNLIRCQYLYLCTSKASSKLSTWRSCARSEGEGGGVLNRWLLTRNKTRRATGQYLYFCSSKASKLSSKPSTFWRERPRGALAACILCLCICFPQASVSPGGNSTRAPQVSVFVLLY
jgi:hypothetical protein